MEILAARQNECHDDGKGDDFCCYGSSQSHDVGEAEPQSTGETHYVTRSLFARRWLELVDLHFAGQCLD